MKRGKWSDRSGKGGGRSVGVLQDCHGKGRRGFCVLFPRHLQMPDRVLRQDTQDGINYNTEDTRSVVDGKGVEAVTRLSRIPEFRSGNALKDKHEHEYAGRADVDVEHQLRDNVQSAYAVRREDSFVKEDDGSAGE